MAHAWQSTLERWQKAGLLDPATVARIQAAQIFNLQEHWTGGIMLGGHRCLGGLVVCTPGGKLLYDRAARPRAWIQVATYDPDLPWTLSQFQLATAHRRVYAPRESAALRQSIFSPPLPPRHEERCADGGANPDGEFWATVRLVDDKAVAIVGTYSFFHSRTRHRSSASRRPPGTLD